MSCDYVEKLSGDARTRYTVKLSLSGLEECPYRLAADLWEDDPTQWPSSKQQHRRWPYSGRNTLNCWPGVWSKVRKRIILRMREWCVTADRSGMGHRLSVVMARTAHLSGSTHVAFDQNEKLFLEVPGIAKFVDRRRSRLHQKETLHEDKLTFTFLTQVFIKLGHLLDIILFLNLFLNFTIINFMKIHDVHRQSCAHPSFILFSVLNKDAYFTTMPSPRLIKAAQTVMILFPLVRGEIFGTRVLEARSAMLRRVCLYICH